MGRSGSGEVAGSDRSRFVRAWARAIGRVNFVPMSPGELEVSLARLFDRLLAALTSEPFSAAPAREVGAELVAAHIVSPEAVGRTIALIGAELAACAAALPAPELPRAELPPAEPSAGAEPASAAVDEAAGPGPADRVAALQGELVAGYTRALHLRTLEDQEQARTALAVAQAQAEARFRAVFSDAAIGIGICDTGGNIVDANQALADLLGYEITELRRMTMRDLSPPEEDRTGWDGYREVAHGERDHLRQERRYRRRDGGAVFTDTTLSLLRDRDGRPTYTMAMIQDVTDQLKLHARLRHQARHDPLTGLPNRRLFIDRLAELFDGEDPQRRVGLCYLDLDSFKAVNDTKGHDIGDRLLIAIAGRLDSALGPLGHLVARIGGDEFMVLVPDSTGTDQLVGVARTVLAALEHPVYIDGHELIVGASVGIVERPVGGSGVEDIMKAADTTLVWAKAAGGRRYALFDAERHAREVTRYTLSGSMRGGLSRGEFIVEYQPLVRLSDGLMQGVEALVRWQHPTLGLLLPDQFIEVAEETGLIVPLGRWVLTETCRQALQWQQADGRGLVVSVNIAAHQLREADLAETVRQILDETGLDPHLLQLELTESAVMEITSESLPQLQALDRLGIHIVIDDFGTGYSNFAYLSDLPIHGLKLAAQFVEGLGRTPPHDRAPGRVLATLIQLAHGLEIVATAEGVETAEQAIWLRNAGCDAGQGWLFGKPGPAEEITRRLAGRWPADIADIATLPGVG
jgi:diguanylate cyclase (GGDEF)-like protein/PAS domain S-box-containing protein